MRIGGLIPEDMMAVETVAREELAEERSHRDRRVVHLDLKVHMDGQSEASVTLTETPHGDFVMAVRPKGKRLVYTGLLSAAALFIQARHAKELVAQRGVNVPRPRRGTGRLER